MKALPTSTHTSRTIMLAELERVMSYGISHGSFEEAMADNVTGKLSRTNLEKTNRYLKNLYGFNEEDPFFKAFTWYWKQCPDSDHGVISLLYALKNDFLLAESIEVVLKVSIGQKVHLDLLKENIQKKHPGRYSSTSEHSIAQNIASSWKQAGFIKGKKKSLRVHPPIDYWVVSFAILMSYLAGQRGDFLLSSKYARALGLSETKQREFLSEASKRDILQYQYSGDVTIISFINLLKNIGINGE